MIVGMGWNDSQRHEASGNVLGATDYNLSYPVKNTIEIFGLIIDDKLNFNDHISTMCQLKRSIISLML